MVVSSVAMLLLGRGGTGVCIPEIATSNAKPCTPMHFAYVVSYNPKLRARSRSRLCHRAAAGVGR